MTFNHTFTLPGIDLQALCAGDPSRHSVVIVLHGLDCCKETQTAELERLGSAGFFALAVNAPHHGVRSDGTMEVFKNLNGFERYHLMLASVLQHASEIAGLVEELRKKYTKVAVMGISMGGYAVFALLRYAHRPDLLAPFLATPDFRTRDNEVRLPLSPLELIGPTDHIADVFPASLFMLTAGRDSVVNPDGARKFYKNLQPLYRNQPELLEYHEYPESDHFMRPQDWYEGWNHFLTRLQRDGF